MLITQQKNFYIKNFDFSHYMNLVEQNYDDRLVSITNCFNLLPMANFVR